MKFIQVDGLANYFHNFFLDKQHVISQADTNSTAASKTRLINDTVILDINFSELCYTEVF